MFQVVIRWWRRLPTQRKVASAVLSALLGASSFVLFDNSNVEATNKDVVESPGAVPVEENLGTITVGDASAAGYGPGDRIAANGPVSGGINTGDLATNEGGLGEGGTAVGGGGGGGGTGVGSGGQGTGGQATNTVGSPVANGGNGGQGGSVVVNPSRDGCAAAIENGKPKVKGDGLLSSRTSGAPVTVAYQITNASEACLWYVAVWAGGFNGRTYYPTQRTNIGSGELVEFETQFGAAGVDVGATERFVRFVLLCKSDACNNAIITDLRESARDKLVGIGGLPSSDREVLWEETYEGPNITRVKSVK